METLRQDCFFICYQPVYDVSKKEVYNFKALLRWQHSSKVIPPFRFISVAEKTGLIQQITRWVINDVCKKQKQWKLELGCFLSVAINISAYCLRDDSFVDEIYKIVKSYNLMPDNFIIEV